MAIHGQYIFLLTNTGLCRIYDMREDLFVGSVALASAHAKIMQTMLVLVLSIQKIIINFLHYIFLNVKLHIDVM